MVPTRVQHIRRQTPLALWPPVKSGRPAHDIPSPLGDKNCKPATAKEVSEAMPGGWHVFVDKNQNQITIHLRTKRGGGLPWRAVGAALKKSRIHNKGMRLAVFLALTENIPPRVLARRYRLNLQVLYNNISTVRAVAKSVK